MPNQDNPVLVQMGPQILRQLDTILAGRPETAAFVSRKLARFFRDRLHAKNALYLDGSLVALASVRPGGPGAGGATPGGVSVTLP